LFEEEENPFKTWVRDYVEPNLVETAGELGKHYLITGLKALF